MTENAPDARPAEAEPEPPDVGSRDLGSPELGPVRGGLRAARRLAGALLLLTAAAPLHLLLTREGGAAAAQTAGAAATAWAGAWVGLAVVTVAGLAAAWLLGAPRLGRWLERARRALLAPSWPALAVAAGLIAAGAALACALLVLGGRPPLNDALVQLLHARYLAGGSLAGPTLAAPEFWSFQFMVTTPAGWVSQYPPGHALLLAAGWLARAPWAVMALLAGAAAALTALAARRLLPDRPAEARLGALLVATSPFLALLAGAHMNHTTAAAAIAAALYASLRAREGGRGWALLAGAAAGLLLITRPLTALVVGPVAVLGPWLGRDGLGRRAALAAAGALPFAVALAAYNAHFFGGPATFGYVAAAGPGHGLGFHLDPWGRAYTPGLALGYLGAELSSLGHRLTGAPLPLVALVGARLLLSRRLARGEALVLAWALLPALALAFYWHHDLVLGPRMLGETAPAWALAVALAAGGLVRRLGGVGPAEGERRRPGPGGVLTAALLLGLAAGLVWSGPRWVADVGERGLGGPAEAPPPADGPSLAFVHEAWTDRLGARLSARGLRLDQVRELLAAHHPCVLERHLASGVPVTDPPAADPPAGRWQLACAREMLSDRIYTASLPGLLWQGDLPGLPERGVMWVRDLGPRHNAEVLALHPERRPLVLLPGAGDTWRLVPYRAGMTALWGDLPD